MPGKRIRDTDSEAEVLIQSRRRCALCFGLQRDLDEKIGQIAHIDQDRSNSSAENLVFLCFEHHDRYDSSTSQSKGITKKEILQYRDGLYAAMARWMEEGSVRNPPKLSGDPMDCFLLYIASTGDSLSGSPFIARNKTRDHVVFICENLVAIDHSNVDIALDIDRHYRNTGRTISFPMRAVKNVFSDRIDAYEFYLNYDLVEGQLARIELGLNHVSESDARYYFFDPSLKLMPVSADCKKTYAADRQAIDEIFGIIGQTAMQFLQCFKTAG